MKIKKYLAIILFFLVAPFYWAKRNLVMYLLRLRAKLRISSLREAINEADKDKSTTGRKNIVVFNTTSGKYEPVQKRVLKVVSQRTKNKSNKAMTKGRVKMMKQKVRAFDTERVKQIENKSLYVTS